MKSQRQAAILEIIQNSIVETQEDLLEHLQAKGYQSTQATISRDIRELSLTKNLVDGRNCYCVAPKAPSLPNPTSQLWQEAVISVTSAQNIAVVKTIPGLAMAICTALDQMDITGNLGTLAGDDTCILIMTDNDRAKEFSIRMMENLQEGELGC